MLWHTVTTRIPLNAKRYFDFVLNLTSERVKNRYYVEFFLPEAGVIILRRNAAGLQRHSLPHSTVQYIIGIKTTGGPARSRYHATVCSTLSENLDVSKAVRVRSAHSQPCRSNAVVFELAKRNEGKEKVRYSPASAL